MFSCCKLQMQVYMLMFFMARKLFTPKISFLNPQIKNFQKLKKCFLKYTRKLTVLEKL